MHGMIWIGFIIFIGPGLWNWLALQRELRVPFTVNASLDNEVMMMISFDTKKEKKKKNNERSSEKKRKDEAQTQNNLAITT